MSEPIEIFPWSDNFATGIEVIDSQHQKLVQLLNTLVCHLAYQTDAPALSAIFEELKAYTVVHFQTEEAIWGKCFGDDTWARWHHDSHADFVSRIVELRAEEGAKSLDEVISEIVSFLTHWLAMHILEADKRMAKVVLALPSGMSLGQAKEFADKEMQGAARVLIDTVMSMYDQLAHRTVDLAREIQRRRQAEAEAARAREAAEEANRAKSLYLAHMSHEIRTPINAINGLARVIGRSGVTPAQAGWLAKIDAAGLHLLEVVDNILDLAKIEAGKFELAEAPLQVAALFENVESMLAQPARERRVVLQTELAPLPARLLGDAPRLQQALVNYASNAVKFTQDGTVTLRAALLEDNGAGPLLRFEVQDSGIGIPPHQLARLFDAFEQADPANQRHYGGTGLGLSITRKLAQLMGGEAGASSEPGKGSLFWFTARLHHAPAQAGATPQAAQAAASSAPPARSAEAALAAAHRGRRILLAEDEPINREVVTSFLAEVGLEVDEALDGQEAFERARATDYDLILMDMQMPELDGVEATERIRALPERARVPIIALTANAFAEDRARCLAAGMNDFLTKPLHPERLYETLLTWLDKAPRR
ncbi:MAG: bacteriohemerythrin [Burkholderiales bacterium]|nr:bacteriohemerythrin [Burkholderiales bacterium]